jgi:hypothetical protein
MQPEQDQFTIRTGSIKSACVRKENGMQSEQLEGKGEGNGRLKNTGTHGIKVESLDAIKLNSASPVGIRPNRPVLVDCVCVGNTF